MADLLHWQMWQERCALGLCTAEAVRDLQGFAYNRYGSYLQKYRPNANPVPADQAWHWFESHVALGRSRSSKACKQWLFARGSGDATLDMVQGGATLIMRDVVREQLRREQSPEWMKSIDAPVSAGPAGEGSGPAISELIPEPRGPLTDIEQREFARLATANSDEAFNALSARERIAIVSSKAGLSLAHPVVVAAANCGKSSLFNAYKDGLQKTADIVRNRYSRETPSSRAEITILLLDQIHSMILQWLKLEKSSVQLFRLIEEQASDVQKR
jgi:hypothetical protein